MKIDLDLLVEAGVLLQQRLITRINNALDIGDYSTALKLSQILKDIK